MEQHELQILFIGIAIGIFIANIVWFVMVSNK